MKIGFVGMTHLGLCQIAACAEKKSLRCSVSIQIQRKLKILKILIYITKNHFY